MKRFMILSMCICLLLPLRLVLVSSAQAERRAGAIADRVTGAVSREAAKAKRSVELKAAPAVKTFGKDVSTCVKGSVDGFRDTLRKLSESSARDADAQAAGSGRPRRSIPVRMYLDMAAFLSLIALCFRPRKRVRCPWAY